MPIKRLFDAVERRGDIGRRVAALVLPISNRPRVTSSRAGKIGLREPSEHTSGPNLASRDNVAHNPTLYTILETATGHPTLSKADPDIRYQMGQILSFAISRLTHVRFTPESGQITDISRCPLCAMCGRLRVGKAFLHVCRLVGAAMCSAC